MSTVTTPASSSDDLARKLGEKHLKKVFSQSIFDNISEDKQKEKVNEVGTIIMKTLKAKRVIKNIITPIEKMIEEIDKISQCIEVIRLNYEGAKAKNQYNVQEISTMSKNVLGEGEDKDMSKELPDALNVDTMIALLKKFFVKDEKKAQDSATILEIVEENKDFLTLNYTTTSKDFGENPSIMDFLKSIKDEIKEYEEKVSSTAIEGDEDVIHKVALQEWLKEQKKNGYIKLPYYDHVLEEIKRLDRPGKVGKVVLKGHPGTGKTTVFSYKGTKENRPYRIISMHQYINFYELIVQNTNLSPTKNQLDFFTTVINDYTSIEGDQVVKRLQELFEVNRGSFPDNFTLTDFINSIFNVNKYVKSDNAESNKLQQDDIKDGNKVKQYVIKMLNYWKDEKVYKLLQSKKELVKGEILDAIDKGENVVLDEIDKVQEKELEGLLAFLDQNTGKHYKVQGIDEKIFIPEWFGVYGTSNDKHKPSGPLGRRFNSLELDYLDKENLTRYILVKIINVDLTTPFSEQEVEQIVKAIDIIIEAQEDTSFAALDFSVRMVDAFINNFVTVSNRTVERKITGDPKNYILQALSDAFEGQTEDIYNSQTKGSDVTNQKEKIQKVIEAEMEDKDEGAVIVGKRLNTTNEGKVSSYIKNLGYTNELVTIITDLQKEKAAEHEKRMLNYPVQVGGILSKFNNKLQKFSAKEHTSITMEPIDTLQIEHTGVSISFDSNKKELFVVSQKNTGREKTETFICEKLYANPKKTTFIVASEATGNKYISIEKDMVKIEELSEKLGNFNNSYHPKDKKKLPERFFFINDMMYWIDGKQIHTKQKEENGTKVQYDLYASNGETLDNILSLENFELHANGLLGISYNEKEVKVVGLETEAKTGFPYKKDISRMETYMKISLDDLGFSTSTIKKVEFDATMRYILITLVTDKAEQILPITL